MINKFVVKRSLWCRGKGSDYSRLLCENGKMCCLGFFAKACGKTDAEIFNKPALSDAGMCIEEALLIKHDSEWIDAARGEHSVFLYGVNDNRNISEKARENRITELFALAGVDVTFKD